MSETPEEIARRIVNEAIPIPTGAWGYAADEHPRLTAAIASAIAAERENAEAELVGWRQVHDAVANLRGFGPEWPPHGNAPLAVTASYASLIRRAEAAEATRDELVEALRFYGTRISYVARAGMESPISRDHFGDRARAALARATGASHD